jgi:deoxyribonuclease V
MQYRELHPWHVSITEAQRIQQRLRRSIQVGAYVHEIHYIAGADIAIVPTTPTVYAGVVVLDYTTLAVVEHKGIMTTTDFPYIPGLLSFREAPALLQVFAQLEMTPDVVVFDGQGIAHPRGLGIASHMGLLLDIPTVGCAKSRLIVLCTIITFALASNKQGVASWQARKPGPFGLNSNSNCWRSCMR